MNHTQLINFLIGKIKLVNDDPQYLEIGVQSLTQNFNKINCRRKIGIDPNVTGPNIYTGTSDEYFKEALPFLVKEKQRGDGISLVFIDGYHESSQVERDFNNSLKCLNDGGFIVIHDCLPEKEETTHVPRDSKQWHGDVYKFTMNLYKIPGIDFVTLNIDEGCCIVWKDPEVFYILNSMDATWENYKLNGELYMNVIEPSELDNYLPKVKETA